MRSPSSSCSRASSTAYHQNLHQYFFAIRLNSHVAIVRLSLLRYQLSRMSDQNIPPLPSLGRDSRTPQTTGLGPASCSSSVRLYPEPTSTSEPYRKPNFKWRRPHDCRRALISTDHHRVICVENSKPNSNSHLALRLLLGIHWKDI